ncbi:unnamed protein product [Polarella glacialis]|uniref:Uncharacterized protein n=1 Tax=Polarella glacialis TaxID=89957 RepID=A0A813FNA4_POLGL|nr:unnamed protein product [Polarella glacialis]
MACLYGFGAARFLLLVLGLWLFGSDVYALSHDLEQQNDPAEGDPSMRTAQMDWHLRSDAASDANDQKMGPVPMVTIEDALDPADLQKVPKLIKDERWIIERWMDVGAKPQDILDKIVLKLMAIDPQEVLPPAIAARVAGVSWRVNIKFPCNEHDFSLQYIDRLCSVLYQFLSDL